MDIRWWFSHFSAHFLLSHGPVFQKWKSYISLIPAYAGEYGNKPLLIGKKCDGSWLYRYKEFLLYIWNHSVRWIPVITNPKPKYFQDKRTEHFRFNEILESLRKSIKYLECCIENIPCPNLGTHNKGYYFINMANWLPRPDRPTFGYGKLKILHPLQIGS